MTPSAIEIMLRHLKGVVRAAQKLIKELEEELKEEKKKEAKRC